MNNDSSATGTLDDNRWPPAPLDLSRIGTDPATLPRRPHVWPGFADGVAALAGEGAVGKSWLGLQTMFAVASETTDLPVLGYLPAPTIRGRAAYITLEDKDCDLEFRITAIRHHLAITLGAEVEARAWREISANLIVRSIIGFDGERLVCLDERKKIHHENVANLRQLITGSRVACIDKFGDLAGDHESDNGAMRRLVGRALSGLADEERCPLIGIHDHTKTADIAAESAALLGAGSIRGKVRGGVVNLWPLPLADARHFGVDPNHYVLVRPEKVNNTGSLRQCWLKHGQYGVLTPTRDIPEGYIPGLGARPGGRAHAVRKAAPPQRLRHGAGDRGITR